jgi:hypothetical protein
MKYIHILSILLFNGTICMNDDEMLTRKIQRDAFLRMTPLNPEITNKLHRVSSRILELELLERTMENIRQDYIGNSPKATHNRKEYIAFKRTRPFEIHRVDEEITYCKNRVQELDEEASRLEKELESKN